MRRGVRAAAAGVPAVLEAGLKPGRKPGERTRRKSPKMATSLCQGRACLQTSLGADATATGSWRFFAACASESVCSLSWMLAHTRVCGHEYMRSRVCFQDLTVFVVRRARKCFPVILHIVTRPRSGALRGSDCRFAENDLGICVARRSCSNTCSISIRRLSGRILISLKPI